LIKYFVMQRLLICCVCAECVIACTPGNAAPASSEIVRPATELSCSIVVPDYPEDARKDGKGGAAGVAFTVATDGTIDSAAVETSSGDGALDEAARKAVLKGRCIPYVADGVAHRVAQRATIRFSMSPSMRNLSSEPTGLMTQGAAVVAWSSAVRGARPADWVTVASYNGSFVQIDRSSIKINDRKVNVWMRTEWNEPFKISAAFIPVTEQLVNYTIDCQTNQSAVVTGVMSNREGPLEPPLRGVGFKEMRSDSPLGKVASQYCAR